MSEPREKLALVVLDGPSVGQHHPVEDGLVIGRSASAGLQLAHDDAVSRRHAVVAWDGARYVIRDLGSRHGIVVDGVACREAPLIEGQRLAIATTTLAVASRREQVHLNPPMPGSAARQDPLTGALNRRAHRERLAETTANVSTGGPPHALIWVDIDHLRVVNDAHGSPAGDAAILLVARLLADGHDAPVARVGGEELAIVARGSLAEVVALADRLRAMVARTPCHHAETSFAVTISAGVAELRPHATLSDIEAVAVTRMEAAKRHGGDRVVGA